MSAIRPFLFIFLCLSIAGCSAESGGNAPSGSTADGDAVSIDAPDGSQVVPLSPENATISFVGTHVGPQPDPKARTGVFTEFTGSARIDAEKQALSAVSVEIRTGSLTTSLDRLDNHLKTPDFFDVRQHPTAKFESTRIEKAEGGEDQHRITGKLTLLNTTNEVTFPATIALTEDGLRLDSSLTIDRTEFGMDRLQERVNKEVEIRIAVGRKTEAPQEAGNE